MPAVISPMIRSRSPGTMQSAIGPLAPRLTELTAAIDDYNKQELILKSGHI